MLLLKVRVFHYELRPNWHKISMRERKETHARPLSLLARGDLPAHTFARKAAFAHLA